MFNLLQLGKDLFRLALVKTGANFADVTQLAFGVEPELQCSKRGLAVAFAFCVADDHAVGGLPRFDFDPGCTPFAWKISARSFLGYYPLESNRRRGFVKLQSFVHRFADPVDRVFLDRVSQPSAPANQRFVYDGPAIQIKTIEDITNRRMFRAGASDRRVCAMMQAVHDVFEDRADTWIKTNDLGVEQSASRAKRFVGNKQLGILVGDISLIAASNSQVSLVKRDHRAYPVPLHLVQVVGRVEWFVAALREHGLDRIVDVVDLRILGSLAQPLLAASVDHAI